MLLQAIPHIQLHLVVPEGSSLRIERVLPCREYYLSDGLERERFLGPRRGAVLDTLFRWFTQVLYPEVVLRRVLAEIFLQPQADDLRV